MSYPDDLMSAYATNSNVATVDEKRAALDDAWQCKLAERKAAAAQREADKAEMKDPTQDVDAFHRRFKDICAKVDTGLSDAAAKQGLERAELSVLMGKYVQFVGKLQTELAGATLFLPAYDVRMCSEKIAKLTADIDKARMTLAPRKKFTFKSKMKKEVKEPATPHASAAAATTAETKKEEGDGSANKVTAMLQKLMDENELVVSDKSGTTVEVEAVSLKAGQDVRFKDLSDCTIKLLHQTGSVRFVRLKNCKVLIGPVAGSCFFENCHNCKFYIASRQIRIHDTTKSDFYLHVLSNPIIEHCSELRFAPYLLTYPALARQIAESGLTLAEGTDGCWNAVDDFRWLKRQQSPNWNELPMDDRQIETI